nr:MAG TPA: Ciliary BBSome complex subunit 2-like protein [Caudoviricetes sp.]
MKLLTNRKQKDVLLMMTANAIIAYDAIQNKPYDEFLEGVNHIIENLSNASLLVGGDKGQRKAMKIFTDKTKIDIKTYIKSRVYGKV